MSFVKAEIFVQRMGQEKIRFLDKRHELW